MVRGVFPTVESPGPTFVYSIGLHDKRLPELIAIGLPLESGHALINDVARLLLDHLERQTALPCGLISHANWPMPFHLLPAEAELAEEYATGAARRSEGAARYLQVCWPDTKGLFPWQKGFEQKFASMQPLLGPAPGAGTASHVH